MVYSNISELPVSIKKLPAMAQRMYLESYNVSNKVYDDVISTKVAWGVIQKKFVHVDNGWVAKGMGFDLYTFDMKINDTLIHKADDGEHYLEGVLSDTMVDSDGKKFTEDALKDFASQINEFGLNGFITHSDWKNFCMENSHLNDDVFISKARSKRNGILKVIKAVYENGKLWIKAIIDKRYVRRAKQFNKMSLEAYVPKANHDGDSYTKGFILGLALDNNAINKRATFVVN